MNDKQKINYTITPPKGISLNLKEIWRFRELLLIFVWRDIKVRYKQTVVGILWVVFQPLLTMLIFSFFFGRLAKVPSDGVPYPVFVYAGLLLWNYFSAALTASSDSLVNTESIIKKVYFPRLLLPLGAVVTPVIDLLISTLVFIGLMFYYHVVPHYVGLLLMPVLIIFSAINAAGLGFLLSSINVKYRDVRFIVPFFVQVLFYVSPVIYPSSMIPAKYEWISFLNPMAAVISLARSSILGSDQIALTNLAISAVVSLVIFILGLIYFRKTEKFFADVL